MTRRRTSRLLALPLAFGLLAAACGGSDGDSSGGDTSPVATEASGGDEPADEPAAEPADEGAGVEAEGDVDTDAVEAEGEGDRYGGDIAVGLEAEAVGLRPWEDTCASPCYNIMVTIYDKLLEADSTGQLQGWLATDVAANDDFTVWTVNLREGVTFHNGVDFNAQIVADMFPIQQEGTIAAGQVAASGLASVEATGDFEVTYTLAASNSAFPAFLERAPLGMVFDPASAAADPDGYSTAPIGTGPFEIDKRDLDNETVVTRWANYWGSDPDGNQLPYLDSISFRPIPDEGTRLDAVLSGTVDAMQTLRQGTIRDARADGGLNLIEFQGNNVGGGMFNTLIAPYDDVRVRRGLTHLNSQENVIEALGGTGISLPGTQYFSPDSPWWSQAVADAWPQFDFEGGVALLQEYVDDPARSDGKAVGDKIDVELSCPPDPTLIAAMQVIEQVWSQSELVNVELTQFDQQTHINAAIADEHKAHCWRFSDDNDPSITMSPAVAPPTEEIAIAAGLEGKQSIQNWANYFSQTNFDAAVTAVGTDDFDARKALYETIMLDFAENVPVWFSGHTATLIATSQELQGVNGWHLPSGDLGVGQQDAAGRWLEAFIAS